MIGGLIAMGRQPHHFRVGEMAPLRLHATELLLLLGGNPHGDRAAIAARSAASAAMALAAGCLSFHQFQFLSDRARLTLPVERELAIVRSRVPGISAALSQRVVGFDMDRMQGGVLQTLWK